jgi:hypothetical protein
MSDPLDRLVGVVRQETMRLSREPSRNRLFFEFWGEGIWNRAVRVRMQRDLDRYREAIRPFVDHAIADAPDRFGAVDGASLTTAVVSFLKGCAVQSTIQPGLDIEALSRAAETLLQRPLSRV